ncbi:Os05g0311600, partial [Oryza sativa Japonica Group]
IWCPCHDCKKDRQLSAQQVHAHLLTRGFVGNFLGEEEQGEGSAGNYHGHDANDGCEEEEDQTCVDHGEPILDQMLRDGERFGTDNREYRKITTMVKDSKTLVYNGCK